MFQIVTWTKQPWIIHQCTHKTLFYGKFSTLTVKNIKTFVKFSILDCPLYKSTLNVTNFVSQPNISRTCQRTQW